MIKQRTSRYVVANNMGHVIHCKFFEQPDTERNSEKLVGHHMTVMNVICRNEWIDVVNWLLQLAGLRHVQWSVFSRHLCSLLPHMLIS